MVNVTLDGKLTVGDPAMLTMLTKSASQFTWFKTVAVAVHNRAANSLFKKHNHYKMILRQIQFPHCWNTDVKAYT